MESPQKSTDSSQKHLTPELVIRRINQFINECAHSGNTIDINAAKLLEELNQAASEDIQEENLGRLCDF